MYIFKILGMLFVSFGGGAVCYMLCKREDTALRRACAWETLTLFVGSQIECFSLPIGQILSRADEELLKDCGYAGTLPPADLKELVKRSAIEDRETRAAAETLSGEFGRGYAGEQTARCKYYASVFEERKKKLNADLPAKKKLYATLCISASLAAIIIFL